MEITDPDKNTPSLPVRPHHALCMQFFRGVGYNARFVDNTYKLLDTLGENDPIITLTVGCDSFCAACPNKSGTYCKDEEKVSAIDRRTLELLSQSSGDRLHWSELFSRARERIISASLLPEVCADCCWSRICFDYQGET